MTENNWPEVAPDEQEVPAAPIDEAVAVEAGVQDAPLILDPNELPEGNEFDEFNYLDGLDVPDPDNTDEEQEVDENDYPDDVEGE